MRGRHPFSLAEPAPVAELAVEKGQHRAQRDELVPIQMPDAAVQDVAELTDTLANVVKEDKHNLSLCAKQAPETKILDNPGTYRLKRPPVFEQVSTPLPSRFRGRNMKLSIAPRHLHHRPG